MGAIGNKPRKFRSTANFDEPEMLVDFESIYSTATKEGYIKDNRFDIENFIKEKFPDIIIRHEALASDVSGKLKMENGFWILSVNSQHPSVRQRYTLGHELGHYLYHRKSVKSFEDTTFFRSNQKSSMEYIADLFAAQLLMPEVNIRILLKNGVRTVKEMASKFDVSLQAMKYRLEQLGFSVKKIE